MREIQLHPGDLFLTKDPARMQTLLGSCVAFTMRHVPSQTSGMCHCLLAAKPVGKLYGDGNPYAYVDSAVEEMLFFFRKAGVRPLELEVKLFGGSDVLRVLSGPKSVGQENILAANKLVAHHGLRLLASDVGGTVGRKIFFDSVTGTVQVKKMRSAAEQEASFGLMPQFAAA